MIVYKVKKDHWFFKKGFYLHKVSKDKFIITLHKKFTNPFRQKHEEMFINEDVNLRGWESAGWVKRIKIPNLKIK